MELDITTDLDGPEDRVQEKGKATYLSPPRADSTPTLITTGPRSFQTAPEAKEYHDPPKRVDIPDQFRDIENPPQQSPRRPPNTPKEPRLPKPTVNPRPQPFKIHKDASKKIEEEYSLEVQASDDSDAEEELGTAINQVKKYFQENPDLATWYADFEADHVQCPACNKILGKAVHDVYQHAATSRSNHNLIHRGVAAAIAALYGDQAPPRRQVQLPREATQRDRRPAHWRSKA